MTATINGCNIILEFKANELTSNSYLYTLPNGYSLNTIHITNYANIYAINNAVIDRDYILTFPVVNSKSPSSILLYIPDLTHNAFVAFTIEKFGQIPDPHYFDKTFEPILVTGDDGKEYKVIPSDQFK